MTPAPLDHPFSTALATKILTLIRARDLELLELRNRFQAKQITGDELRNFLESSDAFITAEVFDACQKTMATLEATVDRVLQLDAQLREIRALEAGRIVAPGT